MEPLTPREIEILQLVARGMSNQEIAQCLERSERTIRTHITNVLPKLGAHNRQRAVVIARRQGIVLDVPGEPLADNVVTDLLNQVRYMHKQLDHLERMILDAANRQEHTNGTH